LEKAGIKALLIAPGPLGRTTTAKVSTESCGTRSSRGKFSTRWGKLKTFWECGARSAIPSDRTVRWGNVRQHRPPPSPGL